MYGVDDHAAMLDELKQLRRGRGLHGREVTAQIGPLLGAVSGIRDDMDAGQRRRSLIDKLEATLIGLPDEMEIAARVALGLHPEAQSRFLAARMSWLAAHMDRNERTAARRVDEALSLLAERLVAGIDDNAGPENDFAPAGWYVEFQQATVMLHRDPVRVHEIRRVRCTRDGLSELTVAWSVQPVPGNELQAEMVFGGELIKDEANSTSSYWSGKIKLPRPLMAGEEFTSELIVITLPRDKFQPYFVLSPFRRCDEFVLRTKFADDHPPEEVWELNRVPFAYVNENHPVGDLLNTNGTNEITSRFTKLAEGFSYGVRWRFPETGESVPATVVDVRQDGSEVAQD